MVSGHILDRVLGEDRKTALIEKYAALFTVYEKHVAYRAYHKACKKILKKIIYARGEKYRNSEFLDHVKSEYIVTMLLTDPKLNRAEYETELKYIMRHGLNAFPRACMHQSFYREEDVKRDPNTGLLYILYKGNKMYFKREYDVQGVMSDANQLLGEQQEHSPHKYLQGLVHAEEGDIIFDIGASEGIFALEVIKEAKHVYLFEADAGWVEALTETFRPFKEKVTIVTKYVSDRNDNDNVSIDNFMREQGLDRVDLIKLDVEGYERRVLIGAQRGINSNKIKKLLVCTYHKDGDEAWVRKFLHNYVIEPSEGYMLPAAWKAIWEIHRPYFSRGVLRAKHQ